MSRFRLTQALDWLALVFVLTALVIAFSGGISFRAGGVRVTARSPDRALLAAVAVIAIRVALDRRTRPLADLPARARTLRARLYQPAVDEVVPLPNENASQRRLVAGLGFCVFGAILLFPQLRQLDSVPDLGDPLFSIWRFSWVYHKLAGDPRALFSPNIFHPHELTLTYSDSMLLPALTTMPLLVAGLHPVVAYNIVMVCSFVASAFALYLLVEHLTGSRAAAFVSGLVFGFYPYRFEHYSHFELQMTYCMPLALLALHRFVATARVRHALAAGLLAAGQLYSSMYYAVFFLLYVSLSFAILCLVTRAPLRRLLGPAALAALLALVLAWPLARTYSAARLGDRDVPTVTFYSATASDYLRAHTRSATWGERSLPDAKPERALFPGVMALLLAAIALVPPIGATRLAYAAALLLAFEISRGFNSPLYPYLYEWLPFLRGLRVPARCSLLVGLTLALLAGFGVRRMLAGRSPLVARVVLGVIVAAIGIDLRPKLQLEPVWLEPPPIYGGLANNRSVVLAEFPFGGHSQRFTPNVPYMYFSLWHWAQIINGYSGHYPDGHLEYEIEMQAFPEPRVVDLLRARGATHVSVNCELYRGGCEDLLATLDGMSAFHLVASGRWRGQPVRLYQLQPPR